VLVTLQSDQATDQRPAASGVIPQHLAGRRVHNVDSPGAEVRDYFAVTCGTGERQQAVVLVF